MGVVYEAEDTRLRRRVALKFLAQTRSEDSGALERFQREARTASALNHPNICTIFATDFHEGQPFIVMELLEGETLSARMARERLSFSAVVDIAVQVADALESAHAKGIVHRDIKPTNIFLNGAHAKVLDFGLAKVAPRQASGPGLADGPDALTQGDLTSPGAVLGTVAYMSPEQACGLLTDARSDVFSLGSVIYQMASGMKPFTGTTDALVFDAILNHEPEPVTTIDPSLPAEIWRILQKALEKDRTYRYQTSADLKTDLIRLRRSTDVSRDKGSGATGLSREIPRARAVAHSIAVMFFENVSGAKDDEYLRDGITEDIISELAKIRGLNIFSRASVLLYRDRQASPGQIGRQLKAGYVLTGSLRRAGNRLRINVQLVDTETDFPLWSERYDREMRDIFDVQDDIARSIAASLRMTLSAQEQAALAARPTDNLQAYDLYLRGRSHVRRQTRQDLDLARQLFENATALDPAFAAAHAAIAHVCSLRFNLYGNDPVWLDRAAQAADRARGLAPDLAEVRIAHAWVAYADRRYEAAIEAARAALRDQPGCEGGYYVLGRALFAIGRYQEVADFAEAALLAAGEDYNVFSPIANSLGALGKSEALRSLRQRRIQALEAHLHRVPEDVRCRVLLAIDYGTSNRVEDALREINLAVTLRPDEAMVLYNAACALAMMNRKAEALDTLRKAWEAGFHDASWVRRDPDLAILHEEPEFERLYPAS